MMSYRVAALVGAVFLFACGQPAPPSGEPQQTGEYIGAEDEDEYARDAESLEPVDQALLDVANSAFNPIEPSEVGVFAAMTVEEALYPLLSPEAHEEGASVHLTVRDVDGMKIADIVRADIPDDSVAAGHVRIEFRQEPEGWFPTNAYRRLMCRRGERANQWTTGLCP